MSPPSNASNHEAVAAVLARLSAAWQGRRYDDLSSFFDPDVVLALPGGAGRVQGRDANVESYRDFIKRVTITEYREQPPGIDVWGDTAVTSTRWERPGWPAAWPAGIADRAQGRGAWFARLVSDAAGTLLLVCRGRDAADPPGDTPWPLTREELAARENGLPLVSFEDYYDAETPPVRRFRAVYRHV